MKKKDGFSLVEVLFACAILALALVPIARAMNSNRKAAATLRTIAARIVNEGNAAAKEDAAAEKEKAAGFPAAGNGAENAISQSVQ